MAEVGESKTEMRNKTRVRARKREMRRAIIRELKEARDKVFIKV